MKLKAGYGERAITPPLGIDLCGYGFYLDRKGESVLDQLKVRALFIEKDGARLVLAALDLIGLSIGFSDAVRREVSGVFGLPFEHTLLACTHTHSGPATSSLASLGEVDPGYMKRLPPAVQEAVRYAERDQKDAVLLHGGEIIEPIGFNRRKGDFSGIDPVLNVAVIRQDARKIFMLNYGCHAVTLGRTKQISADWPGAAAEEIEGQGHHAVVFQGFCGNIDPVTQLNRWGRGTDEDLRFYGRLLAARARKAERYASEAKEGPLRAVERRITLPLALPKKEEIGRERDAFLENFADKLPNAARFIDEWTAEAKKRYDAIQANPKADNIPIQAVAMGDLKIIALPGEVDCQYGLRLREKWPRLFTFGYSGGVAGYLPVRSAYQDPMDYACYHAPKFYGNFFPFAANIEDQILRECEAILGSGLAF